MLLQPCRTTQGGPSCGMWACPHRAPWMRWHSAWRMPWWATRSLRQAWKLPSQVQRLPHEEGIVMCHRQTRSVLPQMFSVSARKTGRGWSAMHPSARYKHVSFFCLCTGDAAQTWHMAS